MLGACWCVKCCGKPLNVQPCGTARGFHHCITIRDDVHPIVHQVDVDQGPGPSERERFDAPQLGTVIRIEHQEVRPERLVPDLAPDLGGMVGPATVIADLSGVLGRELRRFLGKVVDALERATTGPKEDEATEEEGDSQLTGHARFPVCRR